MIIAVDPGVNEAAIAIHEDGELTTAFLAHGEGGEDTATTAWHMLLDLYPQTVLVNARLIVEKPQVYRQNLLKGDPNDLVDVAMMAAYLATRFVFVTYYQPRQWKGQMPKRVTWNLATETLSADELARIQWPPQKGLRHNVKDAIGIALFQARRVRVKGLIPK